MDERHQQDRTADRVVNWLLIGVIFVIPFLAWPGATDVQGTKLLLGLLGIALVVAVWAAASWRRGALRLRTPWLAIPLVALVAVILLSLIPASVPCLVLEGLVGWVAAGALVVMLASSLRTRGDVRWLLTGITAAGVLVSVHGLLQYLGVGPGSGGSEAMRSLLGSPDALGSFLALTLLPGVLVATRWRVVPARIAACAAIALIGLAAALTSRVDLLITILAAVVTVVVGGLLVGRSAARARSQRGRLVALVVLVIAVGAGALLATLDRPATVPDPAASEAVAASSDGAWHGVLRRAAWSIFTDHPILGAGLGHFALEAPEAIATVVLDSADAPPTLGPAELVESDLLQAGAELGILGFVALLGLLVGACVYLAGRARRAPDDDGKLDVLLLLGTAVAFLGQAALLTPVHFVASGMVFAVAVGVAASSVYGERSWRSARWAGGRLVLAATLSLLLAAVGAAHAVRGLVATTHLQAAEAALERRELPAAEDALSRSIAADPCPREAYFYRATTSLFAAQQLMGTGEYGEAAARFEAARADLEICRVRYPYPEIYLSLANLGLLLEDVPTIRTGVEWLLRYAVADEVRAQAHYLDALLAKREGAEDRAIEVLQRALDEFPDYVRSYIALADLESARGRRDEARALYERALSLAMAKLTEVESRIAEPGEHTDGELAAWQRTRIEAQEEIDVVRRALAAFEVTEP